MAAVLVLLALSMLRIVIVALGATMLIGPVRACPACGRETLSIRRRWLLPAADRYEWRWCPSCSWQGLGRRVNRGSHGALSGGNHGTLNGDEAADWERGGEW